jgi:putative ABC transport system permease protein
VPTQPTTKGAQYAALVRGIAYDALNAARGMRRAPGPLAWTTIMLALGIGVNLATFSVVDHLLLRGLPYENPEHLVQITGAHPQAFTRFTPKGFEVTPVELATSSAFNGFTLHASGALNLGGENAERVRAAAVMPKFWSVLNPRFVAGRPFTSEDVVDVPHIVVIGYALAQRRFGGPSEAIGQALVLNGQRYTVLGVTEARVSFPSNAEAWIPAAADRVQTLITTPIALARLAPGVTPQQALGEVRQIQLANGAKEGPNAPLVVVKRLRDALNEQARPAALLVAAAAVLVLIIAGSNAANLLSTQVARRHREFAIRAAIGASRHRLAAQVAFEALLVSAIGGLAALIAARWALDLIRVMLPANLHGVQDLGVDGRTIASAALVSVTTAFAVALAPAVRLQRFTSADALRSIGSPMSLSRWRVTGALVALQIAFSMVLLTGSTTLVQTVRSFMTADLGIEGENVLTVEYVLPSRTHRSADAIRNFQQQLADHLERLPGAQSVGLTSRFLNGPGRAALSIPIHLQGTERVEESFALYVGASPGFFEAVNLPLIAGRRFSPRDDGKAPRVVIVSSAYARQVGVRAHLLVGRPVQVQTSRGFVGAAPPPDAWAEVVGVVDDLRVDGPQAELRPLVYVPLAQEVNLGASGIAIIRVQGDPSDIASRIPGVAKRVDEGVPLFNVQTVNERLAALLGERLLAGRTMTIFAAVALTLSFLGVYGVLAHSVQSRVRELGIRLAIGATPAAVQRDVLLHGLRYGVIGVALGAASSWAVSKYALTAVPGLTQSPPSTTLLLAAALLALSLMAAWVPAARAATVDPVQTLRRE